MGNVSINKVKGEFVPRKGKEEFFCDGEVIEDLFNRTYELLTCECVALPHELALEVFNHAYRICWMYVNEKVPVERIVAVVSFESDVVRKYSWAVAYALFRLHAKFYPLSDGMRMNFTMAISKKLYSLHYVAFVRDRRLSEPVDFRASRVAIEKKVDLSEAKDCIMTALDEAIRLKKENEQLRLQLETERTLRRVAERASKDKQEKLDVWENDSFYKAVNINSILKYVQNPKKCDKSDVKTIKLMLLALCANKVPNEVIEKIDALECGKIIIIENVAQMNTAATEITNHYHTND